MKFLESHFEDYIRQNKKFNLHTEIKDVYKDMSKDLEKQNNIIFYGPKGCGKYTQALSFISKYSPSKLKYERKMFVDFQKKNYTVKISDIHFEIDMDLLGCHAKLLWNSIYYHIIDILNSRQHRNGIILCKNFHMIHSELLDIFYSYMQTLTHKNLKIVYILITENISFMPRNILNRCQIIPLKRPTKGDYIKATSKTLMLNREIDEISNIKNIKGKIYNLTNLNKVICNKIIDKINNYKDIKFLEMRDNLYEIFIFNLDIHSCIYYIINKLITSGKLKEQHTEDVFTKLYKFLKLYNNNYRPIYHLESFIFYLCIKIYEL